jgi:hypothetical protein
MSVIIAFGGRQEPIELPQARTRSMIEATAHSD